MRNHFVFVFLTTLLLALVLWLLMQPVTPPVPSRLLTERVEVLTKEQMALLQQLQVAKNRHRRDSTNLVAVAARARAASRAYHDLRQHPQHDTVRIAYAVLDSTTVPRPAVAYIQHLEVLVSTADTTVEALQTQVDSLSTSLVHAQDRYEHSQKLNNNAFAIISAQATELADQDEQLRKLRKANRRLWLANLIQAAGHLLRR